MLRAAQTLLRVISALVFIAVGLPVTVLATIGVAVLLAGFGIIAGAAIGFVVLIIGVLSIANASDSAKTFAQFLVDRKKPNLRSVPKDPAA